jgi:hypothetical protein
MIMLSVRRMFLVFSLCVSFGDLLAQTADDIIDRNIAAMGGRDKLSRLNSVYEEITTSVMGQDIPGKIWIINNRGMRMDLSILGQKLITVMTKDSGWMVNPLMGGGEPQPLPVDQLKEAAARIDLHGQFMDYSSKGYAATLVGSEVVNGNDNYKVKLTKGGQSFIFFVDSVTSLVSRIQTAVKAEGRSVQTSILLSDYRKTPEGYLFPFVMTINVAGQEVKSKIKVLTINPTVDPVIFQRP